MNNLGSRYIYEKYQSDAISKQLYDWLLKNNYADANLIAKWKKTGYEKVFLFFFFQVFVGENHLFFSPSERAPRPSAQLLFCDYCSLADTRGQ